MGRYAGFKRGADLVFSAVLLFFLLLPMGIIALLISVSTEGGVIFRQERVGRNGNFFVCYKFRTMRVGAPENCPSSELGDRKNWVTPVGRLLRRSSLDELPQLFNVLKGDMSLVGPRPLIPHEKSIHEMRHRYGVDRIRPGLTGLAQIRGRDELDDRTKAAYDARYVRQMGFFTDMRILSATLWQVSGRKGVRE